MIQLFYFKVTTSENPLEAIPKFHERMERVASTVPRVCGLTLAAVEGGISMVLRVAGHDRWICHKWARKVAGMLLRTFRIPPEAAVLEKIETERTQRSLAGEEGRPAPSHRPRNSRTRAYDDIKREAL